MFFLCPAQSLLWVYLVWVHSQCVWRFSNYYFQLFRCWNLALIRFFPTFRGSHVFYLGVIHMPPYICMPPVCSYTTHTFIHPPYVQTPPYVPNAPLCIFMFLGISECDVGMWGPHKLDTPIRGSRCLPMCPLPMCIVCSLVSLYILWDILCVLWARHFLCWGSGGVSACLSGFWCLSVHTLDVHYASSCAFL